MSNRTDINTFEEFNSIPNDTVSAFNDKFVTEEQKRRDTEVTKLLKAYVKTYEKKVERSSLRQDILFYTCLAIIGIFAIIFITAIIIAFLKITKVSYTGLATIWYAPF